MYGWTMGLEGWLWMAVWAIAIVVVVWLLVREPRASEPETALETLRRRFAKGELSPDEYERARHLLES
ncbi:MAG: SHOCT domain-containing protein [Candidatus Limnocylindrales bacterium]